MFASDHTTPGEARPAPPRAAAPRITARPVQPPVEADAGAGRSEAPGPSSPVDHRAPARLRGLPSWLLSQASAAAARLVDDALGTEGLRRHDYRVLVALEEVGAASQADLGRAVWLDRSDLHGVVTGLEASGLLARQRDPDDRRRNVVTLTPKGRSTLELLNARVDAAQDLLLAPLADADRDALVRLLRDLIDADGPSLSRPQGEA